MFNRDDSAFAVSEDGGSGWMGVGDDCQGGPGSVTNRFDRTTKGIELSSVAAGELGIVFRVGLK